MPRTCIPDILPSMIVLAGGDVVLPDRILHGGAVFVDGDRISDIVDGNAAPLAGTDLIDLSGRMVVPGFIDVHVHGLEGFDTLGGPDAVPGIAARLPKYGVTAFCPTTVACEPAVLR